MALYPGLPRWSGTRKVKHNLDLLEQETVNRSGISWAICKSAPCPRRITMPAPHHWVVLQAGCPSCRPTNSIKELKGYLWCKMKTRTKNKNDNWFFNYWFTFLIRTNLTPTLTLLTLLTLTDTISLYRVTGDFRPWTLKHWFGRSKLSGHFGTSAKVSCLMCRSISSIFHPRDTMLVRVYATAFPTVSVSVCHMHALYQNS